MAAFTTSGKCNEARKIKDLWTRKDKTPVFICGSCRKSQGVNNKNFLQLINEFSKITRNKVNKQKSDIISMH